MAGGTGGHLSPALALSEKLKGQAQCTMLTTARAMDKVFAAQSAGEWISTDLSALTPLSRWLWPPFVGRQGRAVFRIWSTIRRKDPDIVVGFGGYLSVAAILAAKMMRIPSVIHEQNLVPGKANRLLAHLADQVAVSFDETRRHLPKGARITVTGNPLRFPVGRIDPSRARAYFGFDETRPVLLVVGGSQGSQPINQVLFSMWEGLEPEKRRQLQILHITGTQDLLAARELYGKLKMDTKVFPFLREMDHAYAASSLAIARAGATCMAEMVSSGLPAILVPYPYAGGHQQANADWMKEVGGAVVLRQSALTPLSLWRKIEEVLFSEERLSRMRGALASHKDGAAGENLKELVCEVAG